MAKALLHAAGADVVLVPGALVHTMLMAESSVVSDDGFDYNLVVKAQNDVLDAIRAAVEENTHEAG